MPTRLQTILLIVVVVAVVLASIAAVVLYPSPPGRGIFFATESSPVVGSDFRIVITVRDPLSPAHQSSRCSCLSI